jgi:hypothetical protein
MTRRGRLSVIVVVLVAVPVTLVLAGWLALQTSWARERLASLAARRASDALGADVTIGRLGGPLLSGSSLHEVTITAAGQPVVSVERIDVRYDLLPLLRGELALDRLRLVRPIVRASGVAALASTERPSGQGGRPALAIAEVVIVDGTVHVGPSPDQVGGVRVPDTLRAIDAIFALRTGHDGSRVDVEWLSMTGEAPSVRLERLSGSVRLGGDDLVLEDIHVRLAESTLDFHGTIRDVGNLGGRDDDASSMGRGRRAALPGGAF